MSRFPFFLNSQSCAVRAPLFYGPASTSQELYGHPINKWKWRHLRELLTTLPIRNPRIHRHRHSRSRHQCDLLFRDKSVGRTEQRRRPVQRRVRLPAPPASSGARRPANNDVLGILVGRHLGHLCWCDHPHCVCCWDVFCGSVRPQWKECCWKRPLFKVWSRQRSIRHSLVFRVTENHDGYESALLQLLTQNKATNFERPPPPPPRFSCMCNKRAHVVSPHPHSERVLGAWFGQ